MTGDEYHILPTGELFRIETEDGDAWELEGDVASLLQSVADADMEDLPVSDDQFVVISVAKSADGESVDIAVSVADEGEDTGVTG